MTIINPKTAIFCLIYCFNFAWLAEGMDYSPEAYHHTHDATHLQYLLESAKNGEAEACYVAGEMYQEGRKDLAHLEGVDASHYDQKAKDYFKKAAEQDHTEACYILGEMYKNGWRGCRQNDEKAEDYLKKAAEENHPEACYVLGQFYEKKRHWGLYETALHWYTKAKEAGHDGAGYAIDNLTEDYPHLIKDDTPPYDDRY